MAHNVAALGGRVEIAGLVGSDESGTRLRDGLTAAGIDVGSVVTDPARCTTRKYGS